MLKCVFECNATPTPEDDEPAVTTTTGSDERRDSLDAYDNISVSDLSISGADTATTVTLEHVAVDEDDDVSDDVTQQPTATTPVDKTEGRRPYYYKHSDLRNNLKRVMYCRQLVKTISYGGY